MVLIYSKDVDDFVNDVVDCLEEDFIRFSESDKININEMEFSDEISSYIVNSDYFENVNLQKVKSIWFNGGVVNSKGSEFEDKCYEILNDSFLLQKDTYKLGSRIADFEFNRLDVMQLGMALKLSMTGHMPKLYLQLIVKLVKLHMEGKR